MRIYAMRKPKYHARISSVIVEGSEPQTGVSIHIRAHPLLFNATTSLSLLVFLNLASPPRKGNTILQQFYHDEYRPALDHRLIDGCCCWLQLTP